MIFVFLRGGNGLPQIGASTFMIIIHHTIITQSFPEFSEDFYFESGVVVFPVSLARWLSFVFRRVSEIFSSLKDIFQSSNNNSTFICCTVLQIPVDMDKSRVFASMLGFLLMCVAFSVSEATLTTKPTIITSTALPPVHKRVYLTTSLYFTI